MKHFPKLLGILLFSMILTPIAHAHTDQTPHKPYIEKSIELALSARKNGNHPFGALLVHNGKVILTAENKVVTTHDSTAHAELELVRTASQKFPKEVLKEAILYTSTEPCAMCAGAIYWSGISHVVYGCSAETLGKMTNGSLVIPSNDIFKRGKRPVISEGPYFESEAAKVHEGFWK